MSQQISKEVFFEELIKTFYELHNAVTGSRVIARTKSISIHELELPTKGKKLFYLFYGTSVEMEKLLSFFIKDRDNPSCIFHNYKSTVTIAFEEKDEIFECEFGYILFLDELSNAWEINEKSNLLFETFITEISSHEIRHEMQYFHNLPTKKLRKVFRDMDKSYTPDVPDFDWKCYKEILENFYQECYITNKKDSKKYLALELDAVVTSYLASCEWFRKDSGSTQKIHKIAEIIKGT